MRTPTKKQVKAAHAQIAAEDRAAERARDTPANRRIIDENRRRSSLPSEHPEHIHGMMCDGQDGMNSYCCRLRMKLFGAPNSIKVSP